ncbi:uncharacterized protein TRAVEDRAFT_123724 [Trametes versicolor FP-101664 SS1]|uniref:uncharacterized protein n=1 Tax=Trametes versicolor (strain FP-101664) TaxID=717944 RepID=UPI00046215C8|nr:uncharacterized protein TRAVEDRAFT_123724 [Trametes versicolor FP-101664 SS1]EIW58684.1 hypothetical protein TRAVEDRAFT_123724 [Trametes versicolor FP-101664 SS1]
MFPSNSYTNGQSSGGGQEQRPQFQHSHSHPVQFNGSPFTVAGMSNQGAGSPSMRGSSLGMGTSLGMGSPLSESLSQSRSHYQPGYLMSASQNSSSPPRHEDPPMVQTKAKLNHTFSGGAIADFGMDSMFESSRPRQTLADEDAPPTASVNDLVNEIPESNSSRFTQRVRASLFRSSHPTTPKPAAPPTLNTQPLYVVVFGYPPDKYSVTVEYFRSLGHTTEPEQSSDLVNAFRIGYLNPAEAVRAVRKNGDIVGGSWMIGAKWADPAQADALLGASLARSTAQSPDFQSPGLDTNAVPPSASHIFGGAPSPSERMSADEVAPRHGTPMRGEPSTPTVGTPIKLAPSAAAFRRGGTATPSAASRTTAVVQPLQHVAPAPAAGVQASPSKGVLGQVSDLIFGW